MKGNRLSRRASIGLAVFLPAAAAALVMATVAVVIRGSAGRRAIARSYELTADLVAQDISRFVREVAMTLETVAAQPAVRELVAREPFDREAVPPDRVPDDGVLQPLVDRFHPILAASVLDPEGSLIGLYPRNVLERSPHYNFAFQTWYPTLMETGRTTVGNLDGTLLHRAGAVDVATPVFAADGTFGGILLATLDLSEMGRILSQVSLPPGGEVRLADALGNEVLRAKRAFPRPEESAPDSVAVGSLGEWFSRFWSGLSNFGRRPQRAEDRIGELVGFQRVVPGIGWRVGVHVPESQITGADARFVRWMVAACLVVIAAGGLVGIWQGEVQTRLLRRVTEGVKRLSRDPDSPLLEVQEGVEERRLARAVDELTERVRRLARDYQTALEERTADLSRANAKLKIAEEYLKRSFRGMPAPVVATDLTGRVRLWNRASERLTGIAEEEIFDRPLRILAPEGAEEMATLLLNRARIEGRVTRAPLVLRERSGDALPLRATVEHVDGVGYVIQLARQRRQLRSSPGSGHVLPGQASMTSTDELDGDVS